MTLEELPPLPEPDYHHEDGTDEYGYVVYGRAYTADQMRDYAQEAVRHAACSAGGQKQQNPYPPEVLELAQAVANGNFNQWDVIAKARAIIANEKFHASCYTDRGHY